MRSYVRFDPEIGSSAIGDEEVAKRVKRRWDVLGVKVEGGDNIGICGICQFCKEGFTGWDENWLDVEDLAVEDDDEG